MRNMFEIQHDLDAKLLELEQIKASIPYAKDKQTKADLYKAKYFASRAAAKLEAELDEYAEVAKTFEADIESLRYLPEGVGKPMDFSRFVQVNDYTFEYADRDGDVLIFEYSPSNAQLVVECRSSIGMVEIYTEDIPAFKVMLETITSKEDE